MKVAMIGAGYVGLVSGACFSEFGHSVTCVDLDERKIAALKSGRMPIYEPGLDEMVARNVKAGHLAFTSDVAAGIADADVIMIAVGTPTRRGDGAADLTYVYAAAKEVADNLRRPAVVVTKSTVPVGTARELKRRLRQQRPDLAIEIAANPEFLREGTAIRDFTHPDRIVVGADSDVARDALRELYRPLFLHDTPVLFTTLETAELIKYATNAFLATKVTFINEMADICEAVGANVDDVARGIGMDGRIGPKFLHPGPGFGGSCFPKDTRALVATAREAGTSARLVETVVAINDQRKRAMTQRIVEACGGSVAGLTIAVLGLTFKPLTDDMREAPSLDIVPALVAAGASIRTYDPGGMQEAAKLLPDITYCSDGYAAATGADCVVLMTEWNQFRALDMHRLKSLMRRPVVVDLRNIYKPARMAEEGIAYYSIGRPKARAAS